jgi:hypothetical protein
LEKVVAMIGLRFLSTTLFAAAPLLLAACSSDTTPDAHGGAGAGGGANGGAGAGGGANGGAGAGGGANGGAASGSGGSSTPIPTGGQSSGGSAGTLAGGGAGGGGMPQGGAGGGGFGGTQGGGVGGSSVAGNAGSAGSAGGLMGDPKEAAQVLDGLGLLKPCFSKPNSCAGCTCDENPSNIINTGVAPENQHIVKQFGGDASVTYNVKLRVVGVAERYWYAGGTLDPVSKVFYTGGLPTIHGPAPNTGLQPGQGACKIHPPNTDQQYPIPFTVPAEIAPADNCYNGFNIFGLTVSSPKQSYFLNYTNDFDGNDRQPHAVYQTDYTVTIPIKGQATLEFYVIDGDHHQVANTTFTVPNVKNPEIKQPYSGNFLELQVLDVTVTK